MRYDLTQDQRNFLNTLLKMYDEAKLGTAYIPRVRIRNILTNACYYDDKTSFNTPPTDIGPLGNFSDKENLNRLRTYVRELKYIK
jgi:hypothetical protein